ncbi:MAG: hypothetical protein ACREMG_03695, partial [Gemmatimonadales bacterium]
VPDDSPTAPPAIPPSGRPPADRAVLERLSYRVALALAEPEFRAYLRQQIERSPARERKLHFQRFLTAGDRRAIRALARHSNESEAGVEADALAAIPLELYFPVPAHRSSWSGGEDILVATALADRDAPVAFDIRGNRRVLSPDAPPATPVLALVPQEQDFDRVRPDDHLLGGNTGGGSAPPGGLYMTYAHFVDDFEGWFKGDPEFEVHMLGQSGSSDSLTSYACAGGEAGGYYRFDQNNHDWTGNVLLYTQTQLTNYKAGHPSQNMRVFVVEDDDTACQIKTDANRFGALVKAVESAYPQLTGGKDSVTSISKIFKRANALQKILRALASFITTSDDLVGNAVESAVVGAAYPGANWVVKGDNNATNGWINLIMR